ncbi:MAG TPA: [acyl-carrier-protein] S-malonyltransferase, partial [Desulfobacteraceae bacterium]|nr:[acyl-carrier-protein] S-malonyltransferase [Desulfobacteraceae bacterium]
MTILMFPGQGSQVKGMGKSLFGKFPEVTARASDILGYDIRELCLEDPEKKLGLTQYTQPALFIVNALAWYELRDEGDKAFQPCFALGHSLGEYNALLAAEVFDFEDGLRLVQERGRLMGEADGGGMAAVMAVSPEKILAVLAENRIGDVDLANFNTPDQTVIAGPKEAIATASKALKAEKARVVTLRVSAPFHSRYMADASAAFAGFLEGFRFAPPVFPVIANATARPYGPQETADLLARQISSPVKWAESIRYLMAVDAEPEFKEVNARILTKMVTQIKEKCDPLPAEEIAPAASTTTVKKGAGTEPEPAQYNRMVGNPGFCRRYGLSHPYVAGSMYRGIASKEMVAAMARAGMIAYLGVGELPMDRIASDIRWLAGELGQDLPWGANLLYNARSPQLEEDTVDLYVKYGVR